MVNFCLGAQFGICAIYILRNLDNPDNLFYPVILVVVTLLGTYLHWRNNA